MAKTSMKIKQQRPAKILHKRVQPLQNLWPSTRILKENTASAVYASVS